MRLIFAGTPQPAVVALSKLLESEHEVVAVITRPDAKKGRGRTLAPSPVKELALSKGIEVLTPHSLRADTEDGTYVRERLAHLQPDAIPVVAYGNLITEDLLDVPVHGWVNLHFSLLPAYRGAAPVQAAIAAGDATTGATTFRIDAGLDTGEVLATCVEEIYPDDTSHSLLERLSFKGADLLLETMNGLEAGSITPQPQEGEPSYAPKISTAAAEVDFSATSEAVDRHIRAHTPIPGAWASLGEQRFKLGPVTVVAPEDVSPAAAAGAPGQLLVSKSEVQVCTQDGAVTLGLIQPPGKKMMSAVDWARGAMAHMNEAEVRFQ